MSWVSIRALRVLLNPLVELASCRTLDVVGVRLLPGEESTELLAGRLDRVRCTLGAQLEEVPDVVLLSACEVGRSSVRWGEELIGMTAAWLHAGVRCVIASPAAVNSDV